MDPVQNVPATNPIVQELEKDALAAAKLAASKVLTPGTTPANPIVQELEKDALAVASKIDWKKWLVLALTFLVSNATTSTATYYATKPASPAPDVAELVVKDVSGKVHDRIELKADTQGTHVKWRSLNKNLMLIDDLPDLIAGKRAIAIGKRAGTYHVECWSAIGNEPTAIYRATVKIDSADPVPPDPTPPGPTPPGPTPPNPPPPAPTSPLTLKLQVAYDSDSASASVKAAQKGTLQVLYEAMVDHAKNKEIVNTSDLLADLKAASDKMVPKTALIEMRKVNAAEVAAALGDSTDSKLDPDLRPKAIDVFGRIAKSLSEVK